MEQDNCKPSIALLTGSTPLKQSRMIRKVYIFVQYICSMFIIIFSDSYYWAYELGWQDLQSGDISLVIGTHSLIAENVEFCALRLAVVDEQQRFGVIQRGRFNSKVV